jgi:hypothetical protein
MRHALDLGPFGIGHKGRPRGGLGRLVRPFQQIGKLGSVAEFGFPHRDDPEAVSGLHDTRSVIAKAGVERGLVVFEYFVDAQLLNHDHLQSASEIWAPATRSQPVGRKAG